MIKMFKASIWKLVDSYSKYCEFQNAYITKKLNISPHIDNIVEIDDENICDKIKNNKIVLIEYKKSCTKFLYNDKSKLYNIYKSKGLMIGFIQTDIIHNIIKYLDKNNIDIYLYNINNKEEIDNMYLNKINNVKNEWDIGFHKTAKSIDGMFNQGKIQYDILNINDIKNICNEKIKEIESISTLNIREEKDIYFFVIVDRMYTDNKNNCIKVILRYLETQ